VGEIGRRLRSSGFRYVFIFSEGQSVKSLTQSIQQQVSTAQTNKKCDKPLLAPFHRLGGELPLGLSDEGSSIVAVSAVMAGE